MTNVIDTLAASARRDDIPEFRAGDTLKVHVRVVEGNRERVQVFEGAVIGSGRRYSAMSRRMPFMRCSGSK